MTAALARRARQAVSRLGRLALPGRTGLAAALVAALAVGAAAQDYDPGSLRGAAERALRERGAGAAQELLEALLEEGVERIHERHVEAARAALELLPPRTANALAARFLDEALTRDAAARDAWRLALELRDRVEAQHDAATGVPFFRRLAEIYPDVLAYRYYVADLLQSVGRNAEAREEYRRILKIAPGEVYALYQLALVEEVLGDVEAAVAGYDAIIADHPEEVRAWYVKAQLLRSVLWRFDAAERTVEEALAGPVWEMTPGETRDRWVAALEQELETIRDERERRERLRRADERQRRLLAITLLVWGVTLTVGLGVLRRRKLL